MCVFCLHNLSIVTLPNFFEIVLVQAPDKGFESTSLKIKTHL